MQVLDGRTAVVTGAGSGIGRALALRCAAEGMNIVAADIEAAALQETIRLVTDSGGRATGRVTDIAQLDEVRRLADHAWSTFSRVDLLCNNAGVFSGGLLWETAPEDVEWTLGVNLYGILHGIWAFVPRMIEQGTEGHIVNTASMAGLAVTPYSGPYVISKFAAVATSECLAKDLAAVGARIGVSVLCPSLVATDIGRSRRNRPARLDAPVSDAARFVEQSLADSTAGGMAPAEVAKIVIEAVRRGDFLIPTKTSYIRQVTERTEDLVARRLPRMPKFD